MYIIQACWELLKSGTVALMAVHKTSKLGKFRPMVYVVVMYIHVAILLLLRYMLMYMCYQKVQNHDKPWGQS